LARFSKTTAFLRSDYKAMIRAIPSNTATRQLTQCSHALILTFVGACLVVHIAQPSFNPVDVAVSYYMNGQLGWVLRAGLVALGSGSLLLVAAMYRTFHGRAPRRWLLLLGAWGIGCVLGGVFPPDAYGSWGRPPSLSGTLHAIAAMVAFVAFPVSAVGLSRLYASVVDTRLPHPRQVAALCAAVTLLFFACLAPVFQHRAPYALGLVERVALALHVCWLLLAGRDLRNLAGLGRRV
jgi:hypothetical protein